MIDLEKTTTNPEKWISVIAGATLAAYGLTRRSLSGLAIAGLGGALVAAGLKRANGNGRRKGEDNVSIPYGRGIRIEESVTLSQPPEAIYAFWRNFENLPRFMSHLVSVEVIDSRRSHWKAKGPAGTDVEWDAEIIHEEPNRLIGWRSIPESHVDNAGSVHFSPATGGRGTEVKVILRYDPPGGKLGAVVAKLFGSDPGHEVREDLRALEQLLESAS
ncbi:MAG: SRPBCC family protein [Acidobacteriota bacterium]